LIVKLGKEKMDDNIDVFLVSFDEISRVIKSDMEKFEKLDLISKICRLNTFSAVKIAGSGHLGSSLSSLDLMVYLYFERMNVIEKGIKNPDRDIFFSSKGHDCPAFYNVLFAANILPLEKILKLRRIGGLEGHPDVNIDGVESNSGSLGMGISKAKGMAVAKHLGNHEGHIYVLTGDGELQEGQIWESLQTTAHQKITNITMIVDHNKIQSDKQVKEIIDLGSLEEKFKIFGWHVERCDGHDFKVLDSVFKKLNNVKDKPKVIIADTIKGKGISFMEGPEALKAGHGLYRWHSGAPDDDSFEHGQQELKDKLSVDKIKIDKIRSLKRRKSKLKDTAEKVVVSFGEALVDLAKKRKDIIVIDADLSADCGLRLFEDTFPERFIENGIAEQDMVSMAGGLALQGYLPIVNSFASFLASRSNEQIYTNATENTKIIYMCHYAGIIPAGPGKSHQSLRDISLFGALPNCIILEPCNPQETARVLEWAVEKTDQNVMIRLIISPSPRKIELPADYSLELGKGSVLKEGNNAILIAYGPVMLNEALKAADLLEKEGFTLKVIDMPWLNRVNSDWLLDNVKDFKTIYVLDDHSTYGGLGDSILNAINDSDKLRGKKVIKIGIREYPEFGHPVEVLKSHNVDGESISKLILKGSKNE